MSQQCAQHMLSHTTRDIQDSIPQFHATGAVAAV
jgi:hypothetical protein